MYIVPWRFSLSNKVETKEFLWQTCHHVLVCALTVTVKILIRAQGANLVFGAGGGVLIFFS